MTRRTPAKHTRNTSQPPNSATQQLFVASVYNSPHSVATTPPPPPISPAPASHSGISVARPLYFNSMPNSPTSATPMYNFAQPLQQAAVVNPAMFGVHPYGFNGAMNNFQAQVAQAQAAAAFPGMNNWNLPGFPQNNLMPQNLVHPQQQSPQPRQFQAPLSPERDAVLQQMEELKAQMEEIKQQRLSPHPQPLQPPAVDFLAEYSPRLGAISVSEDGHSVTEQFLTFNNNDAASVTSFEELAISHANSGVGSELQMAPLNSPSSASVGSRCKQLEGMTLSNAELELPPSQFSVMREEEEEKGMAQSTVPLIPLVPNKRVVEEVKEAPVVADKEDDAHSVADTLVFDDEQQLQAAKELYEQNENLHLAIRGMCAPSTLDVDARIQYFERQVALLKRIRQHDRESNKRHKK